MHATAGPSGRREAAARGTGRLGRRPQRPCRDPHPSKDRRGPGRRIGNQNQRMAGGGPEDEGMTAEPRPPARGTGGLVRGRWRSHLEAATRPNLDRCSRRIGLQHAYAHDRLLVERKLHLHQVRQPRLCSDDRDPLPGRLVGRSRRRQPQHRSERMGLDGGVARRQQATQLGHHRRDARQRHRRQLGHRHVRQRHVGHRHIGHGHVGHAHAWQRHRWHRHGRHRDI